MDLENHFQEKPMKDVLIMLAIVGGWFLLQAYILPKLGVSTWLKESCQVTSNDDNSKKSESQESQG